MDRAACARAGPPRFDHCGQDARDPDPADPLRAVKPAGDRPGDDHEPWQGPSPHRVRQRGDAPGGPVEDGDR
ncbi:hypothetical protein GCM10010398_33580 [Streptomyces fimbriatus]